MTSLSSRMIGEDDGFFSLLDCSQRLWLRVGPMARKEFFRSKSLCTRISERSKCLDSRF